MQETQVCSLGQEDSLEKEMARHSSIPAWEILWTEEAWSMESQESDMTGQLNNSNHSEVMRTLWLQTIGTPPFTVLEATSLMSRCQQGHAVFLALSGCQQSLAFLGLKPQNSCLCLHRNRASSFLRMSDSVSLLPSLSGSLLLFSL